MSLTELTRIMTELRRMGLSDTQIVNFVLPIESGTDTQNDVEKND